MSVIVSKINVFKRLLAVCYYFITTAMPYNAVAQDLPSLNIELKQHKGLTIPVYREPNFFERLLADTTAVTIIVVAAVFAVGLAYYRRKNS